MPAYAQEGKVVCFFQAASKFGSRYATLGFNFVANCFCVGEVDGRHRNKNHRARQEGGKRKLNSPLSQPINHAYRPVGVENGRQLQRIIPRYTAPRVGANQTRPLW
jgi:hypothetical protein